MMGAMKAPRCGVRHKIPEITCVRHAGHDGPCMSAWERTGGGAIQRAEWWSEAGRFRSHHTYRTQYPKNATHPTDRSENDGE